MKTPTLVLATILAMAVVGDSANMEKILQQLGFPTGKGPTDDVNVNHKDKAQEKGKGTQFNSKPAKPPSLDTANAVDEKASKAYGEKGKHPASKSPEEKEVTSRSTPTLNPLTTIIPVLENVATEGKEATTDDTPMPSAEVIEETKFSPGPTQGVNPVNAITPSTENTGQEGQSTVFIPDIQGQEYGNATKAPEKAKRKKSPSAPVKPINQPSQKSKPKVLSLLKKITSIGENDMDGIEDYKNEERGLDGAVPPEKDNLDWYNYEYAGSGENDMDGIEDYKNEERGIDDTFLVRDGGGNTEDYMYGDRGSGDDYEYNTRDYMSNEERGLDPAIKDYPLLVTKENSEHKTEDYNYDNTELDSDFEDGSAETDIHGFLAMTGQKIALQVADQIGDSIIRNGFLQDFKGKVASGLQKYLVDKFDDEYKDLLKDTSGLAAGLNRPVEEADIQLLPNPGATMGNMYAPPGWEIRHKYKYQDDSNKDKGSSGAQASAYTYPAGLGPVLMNGCFGTGYKNGDPCWKAKIPRTGCPNLIDGATYLGVGFDGRGVYTAESRTKSLIQRSCSNLQTYGENEVPDSMTVQGIYDTDVESHTFSSTEEYRRYLEKKSAVTSAKAMFQEEIDKASGYFAVGGFGWGAGAGTSRQNGKFSKTSDFQARSFARGQLRENQTQTFMAMLEMNVFRYGMLMDDVKPDQLSVGFLRDFILLPESYFSPGAEIIFQSFYLRWGTHYIKSAKFGGQLKIIKTKQATKDLSMSEFATKAEADWKMTLSTFSAQASQTKLSSWWRGLDLKAELKQSSGQGNADSKSQSNKNLEKQASLQEYDNEVLVVQGGDQKIAAAITEMYTTALTTELKDWLESIDDYPKPFSFVLRLVSDLLNIPFDSLFPAGDVDYGCLGTRNLKIEEETGRKYYTQETAQSVVGNTVATNNSKPVVVSEIRYCDFVDRKDLKDSMVKRRVALERAVTVYLEEGRLLSSDFVLPAGDAGCETAALTYLHGSKVGVPTWKEMTGGKEFTVIFDMPYDIPGILQAQDELELKFINHLWFSTRSGVIPHLYDGYKNGGSSDVKAKKVSVQGLVMTYDEGTGVFTVTDDDFKASAPLLPNLQEWINGRGIARAEYKQLLNHLGRKIATMGDVPCSIQWSNVHRFDPTDGGKCIHFTAASEGDIFVVFASIPQNHETWIYIQISPEGVALYKWGRVAQSVARSAHTPEVPNLGEEIGAAKIISLRSHRDKSRHAAGCHDAPTAAMRLQTTQLNDHAGGLGSSTLYQSYFVCVTEDKKKKTTVIQYGKLPAGNEERPHVWLGFTFQELSYLQYYSFGNGANPVKVVGLSLMDKVAKDYIICREGTEMINGVCRQKCHQECKGCRTSGSNSSTDCIACKHVKVSRNGQIGSFECLPQCPRHMEVVSATKICTCIKRMEETRPDGAMDCVTECPLTHFDDNDVCKKCSSFCNETHAVRKRVCSGPASTDCDTCKYQHERRCVKECKPGQKAVKTGEKAFTCRQCQPGHACRLGDEREDICPAGTASNENSTMCVPCAAGQFSSAPGAASCQKCPAGKYSTGGGSKSCSDCPAGKYSSAAGSTGCTICPIGKYSNTPGSDSCKPCPVGKYSDTKESKGCKSCPPGKYSTKMGSTSCMDCPVGKYSSELGAPSCADCPIGEYGDTAGSTSCKACSVGQYNNITGATSCIDCSLGQFSGTTGSVSCMACPAGKYGDKMKLTKCVDCPVGQYTNETGSTSCKVCPAGKDSKVGATSCIGCPFGQYNHKAGESCKRCPAGKYSDKVGSTSCKGCPAGKSSKEGETYCTDCPVAQYSDKEGTICRQCPKGRYNNKVGSTSCTRCPAGEYNNGAGARSCRACPAGKYSSAGSTGCRTCPRGMISRQRSSRCACPSDYNAFRGSCFKVYTSPKPYNGAKAECRSDNGLLAMPKNAAVTTFIQGLARKDKRNGDYFIGLSERNGVEWDWRFADNTRLGRYRHWNPREPNNYKGNEDCAVMRYNGRWNDQNCRRAFPFICQIN
ncbi:hypothetical protein Bbelb_281360 [Branchiostoma belcheri]|nr:hypothetical protein Bbelb_281360 [Branchiostoma belcheri]